MTDDRAVELAQDIARALSGVQPNEWKRWVRFVKVKGLDAGLRLAAQQQRSPSLRPNQRKAATAIARTVENFKEKLPPRPPDLVRVLGLTGWALQAWDAPGSKRAAVTPGPRGPYKSGGGRRFGSRAAQPAASRKGAKVQAKLLEGKTKKGKWRVEETTGRRKGYILNSNDVPGDRKPGEIVTLLVERDEAQESVYLWPIDSPGEKTPRGKDR